MIISRMQNPSGSVDLVIKAIDGTRFELINCLTHENGKPLERVIGAYAVTAEDGTSHHKKAILTYKPDGTHDLELTEEEF
jgi:hypothetical protein